MADSEQQRQAAREALGFAGPAADHLVDRLVTPRWYHPVQGGALALVTAAFGWGDGRLALVAVAVAVVVVIALPRLYARRTGVWVISRTPRAARVARRQGWLVGSAVVVGLFSGAAGLWPVGLVAAVVAYVAVQRLGAQFDEVLRAELRADPEVGLKLVERDAPPLPPSLPPA